ncbi:Ig-like domain-containing protein [Methanobrevibacter sp.]|uniref:Ig-like domain-containing protein n=1 Tax=Methanobrevibacter sp. TaxID=66852 RepID=UPI00388DEBA9
MLNKKLMALAIFLVSLLAVSAVSAADNDTIDIAGADDVTIDETLTASNNRIDIYFDASASVDGNGSVTNPYKFVDGNRIESNSNMHFKNGQYTLNSEYLYSNISFFGENPQNTVIDFENSLFQIEDSVLINNMTFKRYSSYVFGDMTASNSTFDGGCDYNDHSVIDARGNSNMIFDSCTFINNYNEHGIINLAFDCDVVIFNCRFLNNLAGECGAICSSSSRLNITGTTFKNNRGNNSGSVIFNSGDLFISDCDFINNSAYSGGSIYLDKASSAVVENSRFNNNRAFAGGSIFDIESGNVRLNNCDFINSSSVYGGALAFLGTDSDITDCTFKGNQAEEGGAIYHVCGDSRLTKSEFRENVAENGGGMVLIAMDSVAIAENEFRGNSVHAIVSDDESLAYQNNTFIGNDVFLNYKPNMFIGSGNYTLLRANDTIITVIPQRYDPRDTGMITPARDQGDTDYCWVFGTIATLESCILKTTGLKFDFSELNVANIISKYSYGFRDGGESWYPTAAVAYLLNWFGPINETDDRFDSNKPVSPVLDSLFHIQNVMYIHRNNSADLNTVKEAILRYGAVGTDMCFSGDYLNGTAYYNPNYDVTDHTTAIVGWDDNFPKEKFKITPPGNGAWIIKNSWGEADGYGCYYVSYYDTTLDAFNDSMFTFIFNDTVKFDKNYQYDFGDTLRYEFSEGTVWYKNVFNSTDNEYLGAVSTYFHRDYDWEMYVNVNGESVHNQTGRSGYGFYTINLDNIIALNKGDTFEIIFKLSSLDNSTVFFPLMNYKYDDFEGKSFISPDNESWMVVYDADAKPLVACVKAFTFLNEIATSIDLSIDNIADNTANITAFITDEYGNRIVGGNVTFDLAGVEYTVSASNGAANIVYQFTKPTNVVSATFNGVGYETSSANQTIGAQLNSVVTANDVSVMYGDSKGKLVAKLTDSEGTPLSANIVINLNGVNYSRKTNSKGQASVSTAKLKPGTYTATISYAGDENYSPSNTTAQVIVNKATTVLSANDVSAVYNVGSRLYVTLSDAYGNPISGAKVNLVLGSINKTVKTDASGRISASTKNLAIGNYIAFASFAGDELYSSSNTTANVLVRNKAVLSADDLVAVYNVGSKFYVSLKDADGNLIVGAKVNLVLGIINKTVKTDSKGRISASTKNLAIGDYTAVASFAGDELYSSSNTTANVVVRAKAVLSADDLVAVYNVGSKFYVSLKDADGNPIVGAKVNLVLGTINKTVKTDSKGRISASTKNLAIGDYTAAVSFAGDELYSPSNTTANVMVKAQAILAADDMATVYNTSSKFYVSLKDADGNPIVGAKVNLVLGTINKTVKTDSKGRISASTKSLAPGKYTAKISFAGTEVYAPSSATAKVTVNKIPTTLTAKNVVANQGASTRFYVTLNDADGNPLTGVKVHMVLGDIDKTVKTDANGRISASLKNLAAGNYTAKISCAGTEIYGASKTTASVVIR